MLGADQVAVTARMAPRRHGAPVAPPTPPAMPPLPAAALLGLALAVLGGGQAAHAVEWIVGGSVSQRLEADTNRDLDEDGDPVYGATTVLGVDVTALTPTTQWQIETGATGSVFGGPGDTEGLNRLNPNFATAVSHNGKYVDTGASFAFDMQPVAFAQLAETGITEGDATQISVQLAADAAYALDARNALSLGGFGRVIRFTRGETTLSPTTTYGANLAWTRALSAATDGSLNFGVSRFTSDSEDDPDSIVFDLSTGVGHLVNPRLSVDANIGVSATRTERTLAGERETEFSVGALGGLQVAWQPAPDTGFVFAASHGLEPSSAGELRTTTAIGAGLQHEINSWASAGLDVLVQRQQAGGGFEEEGEDETPRIYASIAPSLAFTLTPDWALQAGYAFDMEREDGSDAFSNRVFVTLTRQFDILP